MTKNAAIYLRTSYYDTRGDSIESQREMCRDYLERNGYQLIAELIDHHVSGADMAAPDLERGLELARAGRFDVLVTRELDRFARSLTKQLLKEYEFLAAGVGVEYVLGEYEDSPEGQLVKHVRAIIAEFSRAKIAERLERGRRRAARQGNVFVAGNPPFGYDLIEIIENGRTRRTLVVVVDEARWVRRIYQWYVYGDESDATPPLPARKIAARLTELAVLSKWDRTGHGTGRLVHEAGRWSQSNVLRILRSSTYVGEWVYRHQDGPDVIVPVPAIVERDLWERAQRKRAKAKIRAARNTQHEYLLRGHAVCATCGYRMLAYTTTPREKSYSYYRCDGSLNRADLRHSCTSLNYHVDQVDLRVWEALQRLVTQPDLLEEALNARQDTATLQHLAGQLELAEARLVESKAKLDRLFSLAVEGQYSQDAFLRQQRRLDAEIAQRVQERDSLLARSLDATGRLERAQSLQDFIAQFTERVAAAGRDFATRRWLVEVLDVLVRLETDPDSYERWAHIEIDGEHLATVELPPARPRSRS